MDKVDSIDMGALLSQLRTTAAAAQGTGVIGASTESNQTGTDFSALLKKSVDAVNSNQKAAGALGKALDSGATDVSLEQVMIANQKASISFQAMLQVRNRMVSAYQEIMSMQV